MAKTKNIKKKKKYGQHFLRSTSVLRTIFDAVDLNDKSSVFEIGCGDGFLTQAILEHSCARLWVFEIDPEWANFVKKNIRDSRLTIFLENILDVDFIQFEKYKPWILLANLPYQITFPILHLLQLNRALLEEGVIMVQEEVAQKIVKTGGRGYGFLSLFFQHYFEWQLLDKIPPSAFLPPPKVYSRLMYFKPKQEVQYIPEEQKFWKFIKMCFRQPRRTLRNNLQQAHFDLSKLSDEQLVLRAQQMNMNDLLGIWDAVRK